MTVGCRCAAGFGKHDAGADGVDRAGDGHMPPDPNGRTPGGVPFGGYWLRDWLFKAPRSGIRLKRRAILRENLDIPPHDINLWASPAVDIFRMVSSWGGVERPRARRAISG